MFTVRARRAAVEARWEAKERAARRAAAKISGSIVEVENALYLVPGHSYDPSYVSGDKISATSDDDETSSEIDDLRFDSDFDGDDDMAAL